MCFSLWICLIFMAFSVRGPLDEQVDFIQKLLTDHYDDAPQALQIKRYELHITNTGFCRYKRFFSSGKVEYFSFNLIRFKDIDYHGSDKKGELFLHTKSDDVIVQTYSDRQGDVDSMADHIIIPLKNIEPDDLNVLSDRLSKMNAQLLVQK